MSGKKSRATPFDTNEQDKEWEVGKILAKRMAKAVNPQNEKAGRVCRIVFDNMHTVFFPQASATHYEVKWTVGEQTWEPQWNLDQALPNLSAPRAWHCHYIQGGWGDIWDGGVT